MHAGKQVRVDSLDLHSSYSHGSIVTFGRLIRFLCLEFGELLVMPHC
ncbi:hypothetical protein Goshw_016161 [Gossypium schwendimanii]|uniref:Uncharacterized protein n=1 Tax=Gossypium schwendimanii TaxID=34291 RepID=A0A7J9NEJ8_GOSSC|nr:hypothetical protein [Gossypium schwendimanii]